MPFGTTMAICVTIPKAKAWPLLAKRVFPCWRNSTPAPPFYWPLRTCLDSRERQLAQMRREQIENPR